MCTIDTVYLTSPFLLNCGSTIGCICIIAGLSDIVNKNVRKLRPICVREHKLVRFTNRCACQLSGGAGTRRVLPDAAKGPCLKAWGGFRVTLWHRYLLLVQCYRSGQTAETFRIVIHRSDCRRKTSLELRNPSLWTKVQERHWRLFSRQSDTPCLKAGACVWAPPQLCIPAKACSFGFIARHIRAY